MADRNFKPDSGSVLVFEDAGSTDRLRIIDGGSTILYEQGGAAALTLLSGGDIYSTVWTTIPAVTLEGAISPTTHYYAYTRIGYCCYVVGYFAATSDENYLRVTNLPYTAGPVAANHSASIAVSYATDSGGALAVPVGASIGNGGTTITFRKSNSTTGWPDAGAVNIQFGGFYHINSV